MSLQIGSIVVLAASNARPALEGITHWLPIIQVVVSLGVVTAAGVAIRYIWNGYRWERFKRLLQRWLEETAPVEIEDPRALSDEAWLVHVESLMIKSKYSPFEIQVLSPLAVSMVKDNAMSQMFY